ncbi:MAG: DJ-1/PfpI family protein [Lacunisphaera sp.]|nr:DJ-1/PfpI family protein [Lacunisphaera sp.]
MRRNVAILIFPEVEVLDFAGPFEVFAVTGELNADTFHTFTVAETPGSIRARNGLKIVPDFTLENAPAPEVLIVPGGAGTRPLLKKPAVLEWIRQRARQAEIVASVCTGSLVLAQAGLLHNLRATTHYENFADLADLAPETEVVEDVRFTDNGQVLTAAGISAGIDLSLHLVSRLLGEPVATRTARYMEYHWRNDGGLVR